MCVCVCVSYLLHNMFVYGHNSMSEIVRTHCKCCGSVYFSFVFSFYSGPNSIVHCHSCTTYKHVRLSIYRNEKHCADGSLNGMLSSKQSKLVV